jgi:hypothetical protein
MGLVYASNYRNLDGFYDFVLNDVGADKLKVNFIQPSFGQNGEVDKFYEEEGEVDADVLLAQLELCDQKYGLGLSQIWMQQAAMYFRSLAKRQDRARGWAMGAGTEEHICNSYERNVMVDNFGMARLCFSSQFKGRVLEKPGDLTALWTESAAVRDEMRGCNQVCGISHSVRREATTLVGNRFRLDSEALTANSLIPD